jgi:Protein of unknown function (DUF3306)
MSEEFLRRWSRLKRESAAELAARSEDEAADAVPPLRDPNSAPAIDPSSLPTIDSISAESTIGAFLRAGVPDDLMRAALRKAWTSDPTIRDFIGIAENQWDFNAEGAIAGFGSLSAEEYARHLAALALRAAGSTAAPEPRDADVSASGGAVAPRESTNAPPLTIPPAAAPHSDPVARPAPGESPAATSMPARLSESRGALQARRTHGSALPK